MRMRNPRIVRIRRVFHIPVDIIAFDEGGIRHARVREHEAPLGADEIESALRGRGEEVRGDFKPGNEGRDGGAGFGGGGAVGRPARGEGGGDGKVDGGVGSEGGEDGPDVSVLGVEGGEFVVSVEGCGGVVEEGVGCCAEGGCCVVPCSGGGALGYGQGGLRDGVGGGRKLTRWVMGP